MRMLGRPLRKSPSRWSHLARPNRAAMPDSGTASRPFGYGTIQTGNGNLNERQVLCYDSNKPNDRKPPVESSHWPSIDAPLPHSCPGREGARARRGQAGSQDRALRAGRGGGNGRAERHPRRVLVLPGGSGGFQKPLSIVVKVGAEERFRFGRLAAPAPLGNIYFLRATPYLRHKCKRQTLP